MTATPVAPLARSAECDASASDMRCANTARWQIGPDALSCDQHLPELIRSTYQDLNPPSCRCNPSYSQSCEVCDGTLDQFLEPLPGEPCIGFAPDGGLCDHVAEQGSEFCIDHQPLAMDRLVVNR